MRTTSGLTERETVSTTIPRRQLLQDALSYDIETNYPSYKSPKAYIKEKNVLSIDNSITVDSNQQEYVPIESIRHLLIDEIDSAQNGNIGIVI